MSKRKIYRCDKCDPPAIFYGRQGFDMDQRTHKRLAPPVSRMPEPKRPPMCYDDSEGAPSAPTLEGET